MIGNGTVNEQGESSSDFSCYGESFYLKDDDSDGVLDALHQTSYRQKILSKVTN